MCDAVSIVSGKFPTGAGLRRTPTQSPQFRDRESGRRDSLILRPRAPTLWIAESESEPQAGPVEFTGYSLDGIETQELYVSQEGVEEGRKCAIRYRRSRDA
jgi:hypothetical protein